ncbi:hypothetical protein PMAYCL1PPCAC_04692, partial [Pristionchus mayeri]
GTILFLLNSTVSIVILLDRDPRASSYRLYLAALQMTSLIMDANFFFSPIFLKHCRLVYSESIFAKYVDIVTALVIFMFLFGETVTFYFYCVYYRRSIEEIPATLHWLHQTRSFYIAR